MEKDKRKYPIGPEHYTLYEEAGQGVSASVFRALCIPLNEVIAIKILDFERCNSDLNNISREAQTMFLVDHPSVLKSHCSFVSDHNLWVVMPYMAGGSCLHILKVAHPDGFGEVAIATILREVLKGLEYLHQHGHIHRDIKAGNILMDGRGAIKLGDFGVSACLFDSGDRQRMRNTFVGTPCWMAPEVMEQLHGYDFKADIWSFGITALELAHGHAPFSKYPPMKVLLMTLQNAPPSLDYERDKKFSKSFKQMIASCLVKDPSKRPSAKKLLKHSFFRQARSSDYIARTLLEGLPPLGERIKALKEKEQDMLAQKKMPDGQKEELSQNEYKRGISDWNFNLEDLKAQASSIQDDDILFDKDQGGTSGLDTQTSESQFTYEESDLSNYQTLGTLPSIESTPKPSKNGCEKSDDDSTSIASSTHELSVSQCCSPRRPENVENSAHEETEVTGESGENNPGGLHHRRSSSFASFKLDISSLKTDSPVVRSPRVGDNSYNNELTLGSQSTDDTMSETPRASKGSPANSEDIDEKAKIQVIQQRGRFKVTSENVELEKAKLQKSSSMQVIAQQPALAILETQSTNSPTTSAFFSMLQSFLQTNISQRESILSMMKQMSSGEFNVNPTGDKGSNSPNIAAAEKSLLEAAHDREKELLQEISTLQWRLIRTQDELQKLKPDNAHVNQ